MRSRKAGIELSINFIVMLIIAIVVFSFGVKFVYDIVTEADDLASITQSQLEQKMESIMCDSSQRVCIGRTTKEVRPGRVDIFTLGILNTYNTKTTFNIQVYAPSGAPTGLVWRDPAPVEINPNTQERVPIAVQVPRGANRGDRFVLNVKVTSPQIPQHPPLPFTDQYGPTQVIQVIVP